MPRMPLNRIDQIAPRSRPGRWRSNAAVTFVLRNWSSYVWAAWIGLICDMQRSHFQHPPFSDAFPIGGPFENRSKNAGTIAILNAAPLWCGGSERNAGVSGRGNSVCVRCVFPARRLAAGDTYERSYPKSTSRTPFSPSCPPARALTSARGSAARRSPTVRRASPPHSRLSYGASRYLHRWIIIHDWDYERPILIPKNPPLLRSDFGGSAGGPGTTQPNRAASRDRLGHFLDTLCVLSVPRPDRSQTG